MTPYSVIKSTFLETCAGRKHIGFLLASVFLLAVSILSNVLVAIVFKTAIDGLTTSQPKKLILLLVAYSLLWFTSQASGSIREILMSRLIERSTSVLAHKIFEQLYNLPHHYLVNKKTGELMNIIRRAQTNLPCILWATVFHIVPVVLELIAVSFVLAYYFDLVYVLMLFVFLTLYIGFTIFGARVSLRLREASINAEMKVDAKTIDWLTNLELVRVFGKSSSALADYNSHVNEKENKEVKFLTTAAAVRTGQSVIIGLSLAGISIVIGYAVNAGNMSIGDFVMFNSYFFQFIGPLSVIGYVFKDAKKAILEMKDVFDLLTQRRLKPEHQGIADTSNVRCDIEFKNVSFKHEDKQILKDLSFQIPAGKTIVIVGPTGTGKSTILKLLLGFYEPDEGQILIGGKDIKEYSLKSLRELFGYMPQHATMLDDTIERNIHFFSRPNAEGCIKKAAESAEIANAIHSMPSKYKTLVGEQGTKLSGGERQRIALARIFINRPKICLFDEPTSALDSLTERKILQNLKADLKPSTKVVVSHSETTLEYADLVISLEVPPRSNIISSKSR